MRALLLSLMLFIAPALAGEPAMLFEGSNVGARLTKEPCDVPEIELAFAMNFQVDSDVFAGTGHLQSKRDETFKLCWAIQNDPETGQRVLVFDEMGHYGFIKVKDLRPEPSI